MISRALRRLVASSRSLPLAATLALPLLVVACAANQGVETQKLPDGTLRIKCQGSLASCLARADDICRGGTYDVVRARDQRDRYGPEFGTAQVEVRSSEAFVRCLAGGRPLGGLDPLTPPPPAGTDATLATGPRLARPAAPPPPPPVRACIPGATQACIGPGKCEGGQSCLPDGTAFGPCDCGTLGAPPLAPAGTPPTGSAATTPPPAPTTPSSTGGGSAPPAPYRPQTPPAQPLKTPPAPPPLKK
jgi:hypothetical protein